jgi:hypothetical protein
LSCLNSDSNSKNPHIEQKPTSNSNISSNCQYARKRQEARPKSQEEAAGARGTKKQIGEMRHKRKSAHGRGMAARPTLSKAAFKVQHKD